MTAIRRARVGYPAAALLVAATLGLLRLFPALNDSSVALLLLLAVFLSAWVWQSGPGLLAALLATAGYNFLFLPPLYTFTIQDPRNIATLFVFLASGLLIGRLSALARQRLHLVDRERRDLEALTRLSQAFLADTNRESLLGIVADRLRDALRCEQVSLWLARPGGAEIAEAVATPGAVVRQDLVELAYRQGNSAQFPSDLGGSDLYLPIPIGVQRAGALVARGMRSSERMAEGCAVLLGLALERERFLVLARAAEETRASDQMKSTLLAALAHDLKTPVAAGRGAVENWIARAGPSEQAGLALDAMKGLGRRIDELMDVVRLDSGTARPRRERVSAGELVEAAISRFGEALEGHSLFIDPPPEDAVVEADPGQLTEALGHGLENAAAYSPKGSAIRVAVTTDERSVFLRVSDRGSGIPAAERERVFERFVRLPASESVPGTGLGLSIARSLVELNGGTLRISDAEGGGATFEIVLPEGGAVSRVLVVDDEASIRKVVRDALVQAGHDVETAADGEEALARFEQGAFDLVVTDWNMPGLDGFELVRRLRKISTTPILVLTVRHEERDKVRLLDAGADDYVTKPFSAAELVARARALMRRTSGEALALSRFANVEIDRVGRTVRKQGRPVHLTPTEFALLTSLISKPGAVWTHNQLLAAVWGTTAGVTKDTLRVHMGSLRRKLEDDPDRPRWIRTEPWVGYRFSPEG